MVDVATTSAIVGKDTIINMMYGSMVGAAKLQIGHNIATVTQSSQLGWRATGETDPASVNFNPVKTTDEVITGMPMSLKEEHIISMGGDFGLTLKEMTPEMQHVINGTSASVNYTLDTTTTTAVDTTTTTPTSTTFGVTAGGGAAFTVGNTIRITHDSAGTYGGPHYNLREIESISTDAITIKGYLDIAPSAGSTVVKVTQTDVYDGGETTKYHKARVLVGCNNGNYLNIFCPKVSTVSTGFKPEYKDKTFQYPISLKLLADTATIDGVSQQYIMKTSTIYG